MFSSLKKTAPIVGLEPTFNCWPDRTHYHSAKGEETIPLVERYNGSVWAPVRPIRDHQGLATTIMYTYMYALYHICSLHTGLQRMETLSVIHWSKKFLFSLFCDSFWEWTYMCQSTGNEAVTTECTPLVMLPFPPDRSCMPNNALNLSVYVFSHNSSYIYIHVHTATWSNAPWTCWVGSKVICTGEGRSG